MGGHGWARVGWLGGCIYTANLRMRCRFSWLLVSGSVSSVAFCLGGRLQSGQTSSATADAVGANDMSRGFCVVLCRGPNRCGQRWGLARGVVQVSCFVDSASVTICHSSAVCLFVRWDAHTFISRLSYARHTAVHMLGMCACHPVVSSLDATLCGG